MRGAEPAQCIWRPRGTWVQRKTYRMSDYVHATEVRIANTDLIISLRYLIQMLASYYVMVLGICLWTCWNVVCCLTFAFNCTKQILPLSSLGYSEKNILEFEKFMPACRHMNVSMSPSLPCFLPYKHTQKLMHINQTHWALVLTITRENKSLYQPCLVMNPTWPKYTHTPTPTLILA